MECTVKSRKLGKTITFSRPGAQYIFVNLNGQPGTLGKQICEGGFLLGETMTYRGNDQEAFKRICLRWWNAYRSKHVRTY